MQDARTLLGRLRRPTLLVQAAQIGLNDYNRDRSLARLLPEMHGPHSARATFDLLSDQEALMDESRRTGDATYSVTRHIEVLVALIVEARLLARTTA